MGTTLLDRFSVVHAAVGALFEASGVPAPLAIGSHVAFEATENTLKQHLTHIWPEPRPDELVNHAGDVASFASGYYACRALRRSDAGVWVVVALGALGAGIWFRELLRPT